MAFELYISRNLVCPDPIVTLDKFGALRFNQAATKKYFTDEKYFKQWFDPKLSQIGIQKTIRADAETRALPKIKEGTLVFSIKALLNHYKIDIEKVKGHYPVIYEEDRAVSLIIQLTKYNYQNEPVVKHATHEVRKTYRHSNEWNEKH